MTIMAGSMAAGQQHITGTVTKKSSLRQRQDRKRNREWPKSFETSKLAPSDTPCHNPFQLVAPTGDQMFKHESMVPSLTQTTI